MGDRIDRIISETLNRYINENFFDETNKKKNISNNHKTDSQKNYEKAKVRDGNNISAGDENQIRNRVNNNDLINVAALARIVYPDHTPEGAQSQLRKHLKGIKNDTGCPYHVTERESQIINKELNDIGK